MFSKLAEWIEPYESILNDRFRPQPVGNYITTMHGWGGSIGMSGLEAVVVNGVWRMLDSRKLGTLVVSSMGGCFWKGIDGLH